MVIAVGLAVGLAVVGLENLSLGVGRADALERRNGFRTPNTLLIVVVVEAGLGRLTGAWNVSM